LIQGDHIQDSEIINQSFMANHVCRLWGIFYLTDQKLCRNGYILVWKTWRRVRLTGKLASFPLQEYICCKILTDLFNKNRSFSDRILNKSFTLELHHHNKLFCRENFLWFEILDAHMHVELIARVQFFILYVLKRRWWVIKL